MADNWRNWTIGGGVILAAVIGLPAVRGEPPGSSRVVPTEPAPLPAAEPQETVPPSYVDYGQQHTYYNPVERPGLFGRIRQRIRDDWACYKARQQATHWGYPEEFERPPVGSALRWNLEAQMANGRPSRMTLFHYDFLPDSDQLNARGRRELVRISTCLPAGTCPILIEPTPGYADLDEARRQTVWRELAGGAFPIPIDRVIAGRPQVRPLDDADSQNIEQNRMTLSRSRGVGLTGGGGGGAAGSSLSGASATGR